MRVNQQGRFILDLAFSFGLAGRCLARLAVARLLERQPSGFDDILLVIRVLNNA